MALAIAVAVFLFALIAAFSTRLHIAPTPVAVTAGATERR